MPKTCFSVRQQYQTHLIFGGTGYERTLTIYPPLGQGGITDIVVTVTDGAGAMANEGFKLTVSIQPPVPNLPAHLATVTTTKPAFSWSAVPGAKSYQIEIAEDANFTNPVVGTVATTSFTPPTPLPQRVYYWRVKA